MVVFAGPILIAFSIGVLIGWFWKPRWAIALNSKSQPLDHVPQQQQINDSDSSLAVTEEDLEHLFRLAEAKEGGDTWRHMMDRSTSTMTYKAWQRDRKNGPPQYRSSTVFENAEAEIVRDFFWDDEFRLSWDDMLASSRIVQECSTTGTLVVQLIRKFPFFCKDREYIIGRRIWASGRTYFCVTKGVPCPSISKKDKPRRVEIYYSSWCVRPVESMSGNGQLSACEVLLFHHEDMGIPWEIAKLAVNKGMWGLVKKIEPGLRAYQTHRASGGPISRMTFMANINTKFKPNYNLTISSRDVESESENENKNETTDEDEKLRSEMDIPRLAIIIGGAMVLLACTFDHGFLTKSIIFGLARRFKKAGNRL